MKSKIESEKIEIADRQEYFLKEDVVSRGKIMNNNVRISMKERKRI